MWVESIVTVEDLEREQQIADDEKTALLVQLGAEACQRCPPASAALEALSREYQFRWVYCDAHDPNTELPEHYNASKLPALVVYKDGHSTVAEDATVQRLGELVRAACTPVFTADADF